MANSAEIRDQVRLSFARSVEFCLSSIRHRFFRSMATLAVIVLAIAFLMNVLTESIITRAVARGVESEMARLYAADQFQRRISKGITASSLAEELSVLRPEQPRWKELERWFARPPGEFAALAGMARREAEYRAFIEKMDFARKRKLLKGKPDQAAFEYLSDPEALAQFLKDLKSPEMVSVKFPGRLDDFSAFLREWSAYRTDLESLRKSSLAAIEKAEMELKMPLDAALSGQKQAALLTALQGAGVEISTTELAAILEARRLFDIQRRFREYVQDPEFRNKWPNTKIQEDFTPETLLRHYVKNSTVRKWVANLSGAIAKRQSGPLPAAKEDILPLAVAYQAKVEGEGRTLAKLTDESLVLNDGQKAFLSFIKAPAFANSWKDLKISEDFSAEALLYHFNRSEAVRKWVVETAKTLQKALPCSQDEIKSLGDAYKGVIERKGLARVSLESLPLTEKQKAFLLYVQDPEFKSGWEQLNTDAGSSTAGDFTFGRLLLRYADEESSAWAHTWVEGISREIANRITGPLPASEDEIMAMSALEQEQTRIRGLNAEIIRRGGSSASVGDRAFWLIAVSLVVCVVGICNAMLMAVTERFREIATMKCLGSQDGFIMTIFLIESGLQGLIGAILGMILGLALALIRCGSAFGSYEFSYFPVADVLMNTLFSTGAGMMLAMLAAIYPAWVASRMAPMEAMRVE